MASITAHEIAEAASDPLINAWCDVSDAPFHVKCRVFVSLTTAVYGSQDLSYRVAEAANGSRLLPGASSAAALPAERNRACSINRTAACTFLKLATGTSCVLPWPMLRTLLGWCRLRRQLRGLAACPAARPAQVAAAAACQGHHKASVLQACPAAHLSKLHHVTTTLP